MTKKRKANKFARGISGAELYKRLLDKKIFDRVSYSYREGQEGVHFRLEKDEFRVSLERASIRNCDGYNATSADRATRLTVLHIGRDYRKNKRSFYQEIGQYDTKMFYIDKYGFPYHRKDRFEDIYEYDPRLRILVEDIVRIFDSPKCPL